VIVELIWSLSSLWSLSVLCVWSLSTKRFLDMVFIRSVFPLCGLYPQSVFLTWYLSAVYFLCVVFIFIMVL